MTSQNTAQIEACEMLEFHGIHQHYGENSADGVLYVIPVPKDQREKHQGYRFLVRNHFALTAFRTIGGLTEFLRNTGLRIGNKSSWTGKRLVGSYSITVLNNQACYDHIRPHGRQIPWMNNGNFTEATVLVGKDGAHKIVFLSPNVKTRKILPYTYK